jgi:AcrR family transcriptional regulator
MSPRPYQLGKRQDQVYEVRQRVVSSARDLLGASTSYTAFTVEAVAKRADVARATVYYQFESKAGLLQAVCDSLAMEGGLAELEGAFRQPDPHHALRGFVDCFARFWAVDPQVMRRLRALAALDPEVRVVIAERDERRRRGLEVLLGRFLPSKPGRQSAKLEAVLTVLYMLTSFETFDSLSGGHRQPAVVAGEVTELMELTLDRFQATGLMLSSPARAAARPPPPGRRLAARAVAGGPPGRYLFGFS